MTENVPLTRPQLRRLLRNARRALTPAQQRQATLGLYRQLAQHPLFRRARHIALYLPNDGEIDPRLLMREAQRRGKCIYLPVLHAWPRTRMVFQRFEQGEKLKPNRFRIPEPIIDRKRQRPIWALDLILLPLVGFDEVGGRLGMGGGFYDRSLAYQARRQTWKNPCCWGWRMNARRSSGWRRPVGMFRCRARSRTVAGTWRHVERRQRGYQRCGWLASTGI